MFGSKRKSRGGSIKNEISEGEGQGGKGGENDELLRQDMESGKNLMKAFRPFRLLLLVFGRWPMYHEANEDGTFSHEMQWNYLRGIYFIGVTIYFVYLLVAGGFNLGSILLAPDLASFDATGRVYDPTNNTDPDFRRRTASTFREYAMIQRHLALCVGIWTNIIICLITSFNVIWKHKYMVNYFNFWTRAVQTMHMDVAKGAAKNSWIYVGIVSGVTGLLIILALARVGATMVGAPILMAMFSFRFFTPTMLAETSLEADEEIGGRWAILLIYRLLGGIGFLYVFIGAKAYILLYLFLCKLLRNAFASWNGRAYAAILRGADFTQTKEGRTTFTLLFKDHCVLLDLLEGTNRFFSGVLESYFLLQVSALCFELYAAIRAARYGHDQVEAATQGYFIREYDFIPLTLMFVLNTAIIYTSSKAAAFVGEEAIAGLEVIRRKTLLGRKTDEELYFILSMYTSYISYRRIELSAGGYFYINKEFVVTIFSTVLSYFIILFQFQPKMDRTAAFDDREEANKRKALAKFLIYIENSRDCSWAREVMQDCN